MFLYLFLKQKWNSDKCIFVKVRRASLACPVPEDSLTRWNQDELVAKWLEEKTMEKERKGSWSKHITKSAHDGGSVMAWAWGAANGIRLLVFIDDVTADGDIRSTNPDVHKAITLNKQ